MKSEKGRSGSPVREQDLSQASFNKMKKALSESVSRYETLIETVPVGIVENDTSGIISYCNGVFADLVGCAKGELIGKHIWEFVIPETRSAVKDDMTTILQDRSQPTPYITKLARKDGRTIDIQIDWNYKQNRRGNITGFISSVTDITGRERGEEALRESEDRFRTLIEKSKEIITLNDINRKCIYVSPSVTAVLGYSPEEYRAMDVHEFCHPDDFKMLEESRVWVLEHPGETSALAYRRMRHKDGSWRWMESAAHNLLHNPSVRAVVINFRDITERKEAEDALRKSEEKYRNIFENAVEGIFQTTPEGQFLSVNPALAHMHGFESPDEFIHTITSITGQIYVDPQDHKRMMKLLKEQDVVKAFQAKMYKKDGSIIWVSITFRGVKDATGKIEHHEGIIEDITGRKEAEKKLLESEERYRTAIENSNDGVGLVSNGQYIYVNQKFLDIFGYEKPEDVIGKRPLMSVHPDDFEMLKEYGGKRQRGEPAPERYEYKGIRKDGTTIFIEVSIAETTYRGESVVLSYLRDVTERKRIEEALKQSEERFRALVEKSAEVIFLTDRNRKRTYVSPSITRVFGYSVEEFLSTDRTGFTHPDDIIKMETARSQILANPSETVTFIDRIRHKDGSWRWVESTLSNLLNEPSIHSMVANIHDITERKVAEEALRESENKFRDLAEKSIVGIYIIHNKTFKYVNARFAEIHGYTIEEIIDKKTSRDMVFLEDLPSVEENVQTRTSDRITSQHYEFRIVTKTGEIKYVEVYGTRTIFQSKPATIGTILDITERKQAEEALKKSEEKYRNIFENAVEGIFQTTLEGQFLSANPALAHIVGFDSPEALTASTASMVKALYVNQEDRGALIDLIETYGFTEGFETQHLRKDGKIIWVSINARAVHDESGRTAYLEDTVADITKRKFAEEALQESEAKYRNVVDHLIVGFYIIQDNRFRFVNRRFCEMSGYSYAELVDKISPLDLIHDDDKKFIAELIMRREAGEADYTGSVYKGVKKDGQIMIVKGLSSFLIYNGRPAVAGTIIDITRERTLESQLRQAQKMEAVGTLAGGIAHDFNNILTAIIGYGRLLQMKMADMDPLRTYVAHMLSSSEKAANLTRNLLTFSRKQIVELKPVKIGKIVKGMERLLKSLLTEDIALKIISPDSDIAIMADMSQIEQVLLNLASNANDAMPRGGTLTIETKEVEFKNIFVDGYDYIESGQYAFISVTDTGTGIDEKTRNKIFEPFFTTKEVGRGTGLGLSIVHGIVDQHHGYITVDSEPRGGTVFNIYLPVVKAAVEETEAISPVAEGGTETILVAEDDAQVRSLTTEILNSAGYTVIEAIDGEDAVEKFVEHSDTVELLLFDVVMPRKNGKEAHDEIKKINPDIRVIFMSGYTGDVIIGKGIIEKEYDFIQKPLSPNELLIRVREALGRCY